MPHGQLKFLGIVCWCSFFFFLFGLLCVRLCVRLCVLVSVCLSVPLFCRPDTGRRPLLPPSLPPSLPSFGPTVSRRQSTTKHRTVNAKMLQSFARRGLVVARRCGNATNGNAMRQRWFSAAPELTPEQIVRVLLLFSTARTSVLPTTMAMALDSAGLFAGLVV